MTRVGLVVVLGLTVLGGVNAATRRPGLPLQAETAVVTGAVAVAPPAKGATGLGEVAVWLKPLAEAGRRVDTPLPRVKAQVVQRNKRFVPHLLVVPVGAVVEFPNVDPFFHNVFSLFNGKRFDLGLYEAGSSRAVTFTDAGVCYVFCNIHPEMSGVVVVVDTPYYTVSNRDGTFRLANVPPGRYVLSVWHERYKGERVDKADGAEDVSREVRIAAGGTSLGTIRLVDAGQAIASHKNKYGHDYNPPRSPGALYK